MNEEKFKHFLKSLENVNDYDEYQDLLAENKLSHYGQLQDAHKSIIDRKMKERYNLLDAVDGNNIKDVTNKILEKDYPHLNKVRQILGETPLEASYEGNGGGSYTTMSNVPGNSRIVSNGRLATLGHEIGHGNSDLYEKVSQLMREGDTEEANNIRSILRNSKDPDVVNFLKDVQAHPDIHKEYSTKNALSYDTPKLEQHAKILQERGTKATTDIQNQIDDYLAADFKNQNAGTGDRSRNKMSQYIHDYDKKFIPLESKGSSQLQTDYKQNKQISDLVDDNSVLTSNSDRHHGRMIDEVDGLGKLDKGNWEDRNIKRLFAGKGLKAISGALPLVGALGAAASISNSQASELMPLGGIEGIGKGSDLESNNYEDMKKNADYNSLRRQAVEKLRK
jgi:hypothetical protein